MRHRLQLIYRTKSSNGFDPYVSNALNSQEETTTSENTVDRSQIDPGQSLFALGTEEAEVPVMDPAAIKTEEGRQWQWAVAEEMLPTSKDERASQILEEVGRMEVWADSAADRVKVVKEKLDDMEEEGGVILNLKDSSREQH